MTLRKTVSSQKAKDFFAQVFKPTYESYLSDASRTPLVLMLWGPYRRTRAWSLKRQAIRDQLEQLGHTVFLSEQLGIPSSALNQKPVEFLQSETADLIVALQPSYDTIGTVQQFVEHRVVDAKMLLFVDQAAPDRHRYDRALIELENLYHNVGTYQSPEDVAGDHLVQQITARISAMQLVKYRALQRARGWGLKLDDSTSGPARTAPLQPFRYNLLELYREHRDEIDVLNDAMPLFFLTYISYTRRTALVGLSKEIGLAGDSILKVVAPLLRAEMLVHSDGTLAATAFGKRMLEGLGFSLPAKSIVVRHPVSPSIVTMTRRRFAAITTGTGLALAAAMLLLLSVLQGANLIQNQQPLELTTARPAITITTTPTRIPAPTIIPTPSR
jgi:hypothetical protein